jgi:hypothetical protein
MTINLSTINLAICLQIEQLLSPITMPPHPMPTPNPISYAVATVTIPPHPHHTLADPNNINNLPSNIYYNNNDYNNDYDFTIFSKNKQNSTTNTNLSSTHFCDGISSIKAASAELWNKHKTIALLNTINTTNYQLCITKGCQIYVSKVTRPSIWIKYHFPTTIPSM